MVTGASRAWLLGVVLGIALATPACADDGVDGAGGSSDVAETGVGAGTGDDDDDDDDDDDGSTGSGDGGAGATSTSTVASTGSGQGGNPVCPPLPACDAPLPDLGPERDFEHNSSEVAVATGFPVHRGRDQYVNVGDPVWIMGKFTYGVFDKDLKDEEVDIWMQRDCAGTWEKIATVLTTEEGAHETVEGVEDTGGWIYYQLPHQLGLGLHRFELVVAGDLSHVPLYVHVVEPGTPIVVTDVDGTLTTSETAEFGSVLTGETSEANADAPAVLSTLAQKGYLVYYLSARPEFLVERTRDFVRERGFPFGLVRTTLNTTGATGEEAWQYKLDQLQRIAAKGLVPSWAFGNTETDAQAFFDAGIQPATQRVMYLFEDTLYGSRTIPAYAALLPEVGALPLTCQ